MLSSLILIATVSGACFGASFVPCPDQCRCELENATMNIIGVDCTSLEFLHRLLPKQTSAIVNVNVSGAALTKVDPALKLLKNLESLDLSNNKLTTTAQIPQLPNLKYLYLRSNQLKDISLLPKNLEFLDVSSNYVHQVGKELTKLEHLKELNMFKNPIDCNCESILYHSKLIQNGVNFTVPVRCSTPKTFKDKELEFITCSMIADDILESMMSDQAPFDDDTFQTDDNDNDYSEDHDYIYTKGTDKVEEDNSKSQPDLEGSGEGSGDLGIIEKEESPIACHENCSTLAPVGLHDETNASPPPSIPESAKILFEDILGKQEPEQPKPIEEPIKKIETKVYEQIPIKEEEELGSDKSDVESIPTKDEVPGEMERAVVGGSTRENNNMTYYVLGGILVVFIALTVVVIMRKRGRKNRRRKIPSKENGHYEEMKPLKSNGRPEEKIIPKTPENTPLIGEENGKIVDNDPLKGCAENGTQKTESNNHADSAIEPDSQHSPKSDTLKVTIKASEIPDSVPKTPLLVHRQLNNDGNYTTTLQPK